MQIVSHRGLPNAFPENTMAGYRKVMELNVDMLEIDVHLTKDQQLVVIHDETIDRTSNGKGRIANYTLPELKHLILVVIKTLSLKGNKYQL